MASMPQWVKKTPHRYHLVTLKSARVTLKSARRLQLFAAGARRLEYPAPPFFICGCLFSCS
jgi:hypothetical protein